MSAETGIETALVTTPGVWNAVAKVTLNFIDPEGEVAVSQFYVTGFTGSDTLADLEGAVDILATGAAGTLTNAQLQAYAIEFRSNVTRLKPPRPSNEPDNIEDKVFLEYMDLEANQVRLNVPMPKSAVFMTDGETVNPTNINAWSTDLIAGVTSGATTLTGATAAGNPLLAYIKGYYRRAKTRRRLRQGISTEIGG